MTFGERLTRSRIAMGYTQKSFADALDISPTRLNYWEHDKREPDVEWIKKIASVLNVSTDYLIGNRADAYSALEQSLVDKFRQLDDHGKHVIELLINVEFERVTKNG